MSKRIIKTVEELSAAIEADELHGEIGFPAAGNWAAFLWLRRYAKEQTGTELTSGFLRKLAKPVSEFHGISLARILRLSLFEFRTKLREAGVGLEAGTAPSPNEPRDKWLYEQCCARVVYSTLIIQLKRRAASDSWEPIESVSGLKKAANRYAKRHNLRPIPRRQAGRPKKEGKVSA